MRLAKLFVLSAIPLSACAGQVEMRAVSGQSATILTTYRNSVRDFAAGQTALNSANEQRLDQLRNQMADRKGEVANRRDAWELGGNKEAIRRFAVVSNVTAEEALADMAPRLPTPPPPALTYDSAGMDAVLKQLVSLRKPISVEQQLQDLVEFGTKLRERYRGNIEEAEKEAVEAASAGGDAATTMAAEAMQPNE